MASPAVTSAGQHTAPGVPEALSAKIPPDMMASMCKIVNSYSVALLAEDIARAVGGEFLGVFAGARLGAEHVLPDSDFAQYMHEFMNAFLASRGLPPHDHGWFLEHAYTSFMRRVEAYGLLKVQHPSAGAPTAPPAPAPVLAPAAPPADYAPALLPRAPAMPDPAPAPAPVLASATASRTLRARASTPVQRYRDGPRPELTTTSVLHTGFPDVGVPLTSLSPQDLLTLLGLIWGGDEYDEARRKRALLRDAVRVYLLPGGRAVVADFKDIVSVKRYLIGKGRILANLPQIRVRPFDPSQPLRPPRFVPQDADALQRALSSFSLGRVSTSAVPRPASDAPMEMEVDGSASGNALGGGGGSGSRTSSPRSLAASLSDQESDGGPSRS